MWPTIDRARRRLSGSGASAPDEAADSVVATPASGAAIALDAQARRLEDVVIVLGAVEVDQLRVALELVLGDAIERPDTPARIERALSLLMARRGAEGKPRVLRRPAAISTPESWEIHLEGVEQVTAGAVREAGRSGVFAA